MVQKGLFDSLRQLASPPTTPTTPPTSRGFTLYSRGLTLYGKVLIIKSLGLSNLIYSISNVNVPKDIGPMVKDKMFRFLWKNKKDKIKRTSMYQDLSTGGLQMVDIELTIN